MHGRLAGRSLLRNDLKDLLLHPDKNRNSITPTHKGSGLAVRPRSPNVSPKYARKLKRS